MLRRPIETTVKSGHQAVRLDDVRFIPKSELAANALRQREPLGGRIDRIVVVRGKEPSVRRPAGNSRKLNFAARRQRRAEG